MTGMDVDGRPLNDADGRPRAGLGSWTLRRRFLYAVNLFCAAIVVYVLVANLDTAPAEAAVTMAFFVIGASVGSYVFGAVWEDVRARSWMAAAPAPAASTTTKGEKP